MRSVAIAATKASAPQPAIPADPDFSRLYFAIEAARATDRPMIVQFVGVSGDEGVSTIATGFALRAAREAQTNILVLDCGVQTKTSAGQSMLSLFQAGKPLAGAPRRDHKLLGHDRVRWAALGHDAAASLDLRLLTAFAEELRRGFGVVVLDCAAAEASPLASVLSRIADGTIIVAAAGRTRRRSLQRMVAELTAMGGQVIGIVLSRQRDWLPGWLARRMA